MGLFNNIGEPKKATRTRNILPPLFLTYRTEDTDSGLYRWIVDSVESSARVQKRGFKTNGPNIIVNQDCTLIVLVNAIKSDKGDVALKIKLNNVIKQGYLAKNNRKNELISVNYVGIFKSNDVINIQHSNVKNIQVTIYGAPFKVEGFA